MDVINLETIRKGCAHCSLKQLCLPAGIAADDLARLEDIVRKRRALKAGDVLYRQGEALGAVFVSRDGAFKTVALNAEGDETIIGFHLPGELVGLDALGSGRHRCDAVALTEGSVCEVPFEQLTSVATQLPSLQRQLFRVIGQSVDRDQDHSGMLVRLQANERIALFLHGISERYGHIGHSTTMLRLPMSRQDIAKFLGLALETVSRGFKRLQDDAVIAARGRAVEILDPKALLRLAHGTEQDARSAPGSSRLARNGRVA